ncbi:MAG: HlyD family secretion protein [Marinilabiliales bacterium]|nr:HlyD family secretion protein [Marinilabiliales bacterium]
MRCLSLTDGKSVGTDDPLFRLADVRSLLVELKVKTREGSLLRRGQRVTLSVTSRTKPYR